ncbi:MAG: hypothetical protein JWQ88_3353 [Rhodoferax sp.]|nr:hypothetical protein [Rhodoferax sp.]
MFKLIKIAPIVWMAWRWYRGKNAGMASQTARRY